VAPASLRRFSTKERLDDFMIHVIPTFIGEGIPLIAPGRRTRAIKTHLLHEVSQTGVVKLHYTVRK